MTFPAKRPGELDIEVFAGAGGMAEGFRRAGLVFDFAVDMDPEHAESYERNLGQRPVRMDSRDLLRLARMGWHAPVRLAVFDPPCAMWSRAGKRKGLDDDRDMLRNAAALIEALRPRCYVIGNIPGLEDQTNLRIVQDVIGGLARFGYCTVDFAALDAADYGVPQHRVRPFWFGHLEGACIRWPAPTHGQATRDAALPGLELLPYVTCGEALAHLSSKDLGRRVKLRKRDCNTKQHGSVFEKPARVVGTSNLSDGNVVVPPLAGVARVGQIKRASESHPPSRMSAPANTVLAGDGGGSRRAVILDGGDRHAPAQVDQPAPVVAAKIRGQGAQVLELPARSYKRSTKGPQSSRVAPVDRPATTVQCRTDRLGSGMLIDWMRDRPSTTVMADPRLAPPGARDRKTWAVKGGGRQRSTRDAVMLSPRAAAILQGFPESWVFAGATKRAVWNQIGQAMPPAVAEVVARAIAAQMAATVEGERPPGYVESFTPPPPLVAEAPREQLSLVGDARLHVPLPPGAVLYGKPDSEVA